MKINFSFFFLLFCSVSNAVQFSKQEIKNIQIYSKTFFTNMKNRKKYIPSLLMSSNTTSSEKDSNNTTKVEYNIFI